MDAVEYSIGVNNRFGLLADDEEPTDSVVEPGKSAKEKKEKKPKDARSVKDVKPQQSKKEKEAVNEETRKDGKSYSVVGIFIYQVSAHLYSENLLPRLCMMYKKIWMTSPTRCARNTSTRYVQHYLTVSPTYCSRITLSFYFVNDVLEVITMFTMISILVSRLGSDAATRFQRLRNFHRRENS
jgi:hypothetical protein